MKSTLSVSSIITIIVIASCVLVPSPCVGAPSGSQPDCPRCSCDSDVTNTGGGASGSTVDVGAVEAVGTALPVALGVAVNTGDAVVDGLTDGIARQSIGGLTAATGGNGNPDEGAQGEGQGKGKGKRNGVKCVGNQVNPTGTPGGPTGGGCTCPDGAGNGGKGGKRKVEPDGNVSGGRGVGPGGEGEHGGSGGKVCHGSNKNMPYNCSPSVEFPAVSLNGNGGSC